MQITIIIVLITIIVQKSLLLSLQSPLFNENHNYYLYNHHYCISITIIIFIITIIVLDSLLLSF